MFFWLIFLALFGLVAIEQSSIYPLIFAGVVMLVGYPYHRRQKRIMRRGKRSPVGIELVASAVGLFLIFVILNS